MENGNYIIGESWCDKAVERGAGKKSVDNDLRSIFMRAEPPQQEESPNCLLGKDINRYIWVKK